MKKLDRILVPTDFSKGARAACRYADLLNNNFGGKIDLLHIVPTVKYIQDSFKKIGVPIDMIDDPMPDVEKNSRLNLEKDMSALVRKEYQGRCITETGLNAAKTISNFAKREKYDIIVMGLRGDSAESFIKMGSITTRLVRLSHIPVLTVPEKTEPGEINNIMVPTDYSDESLQALIPAAFIAYKTGAKITLFHVLELYGSLSEAHGITVGKNSMEAARGRVFEKVRDFLAAYQDYQLRLDDDLSLQYSLNGDVRPIQLAIEIDKGYSAHHKIVTYAAKNADIVIISSHGRSKLPHIMLGSTAEKAMQWSEVPVLINRTKF